MSLLDLWNNFFLLNSPILYRSEWHISLDDGWKSMKYRCYTFLGFTTTSLDHEWLPSPLPLEKEAWALSFVSSTLAFLPVCNTIGPQNRQSVKAFCLAIYGVRVNTAKVCEKHHYKMNFATLGGNLGRARISNCQLVFAQLPLKGWNFSFPLIPVFELPGIWH